MADDMETNGNFIRITNRELWDMMSQVRDRVANLEQRVDNVLGENVQLRKNIRSLELRYYSILAGLVTGIALMGAFIVRGFHA